MLYCCTSVNKFSIYIHTSAFLSDESFDDDDFDEDAYYESLGTRPPLDTGTLGSAYQKMVELFCLCTEEDPGKRPSATHIVQALESNSLSGRKDDDVIVID